MEVCNEVLVQRRVAPDEAPLPAAGDWGALHRSEGSLCDTCQCGMFILLAVSPLGDEGLAVLLLELFVSTPQQQRWMGAVGLLSSHCYPR